MATLTEATGEEDVEEKLLEKEISEFRSAKRELFN